MVWNSNKIINKVFFDKSYYLWFHNGKSFYIVYCSNVTKCEACLINKWPKNDITSIKYPEKVYVLPSFMTSNISSLAAYMHLPINPAFILGFFVIDQALCFYIHFFTPSKVVREIQ